MGGRVRDGGAATLEGRAVNISSMVYFRSLTKAIMDCRDNNPDIFVLSRNRFRHLHVF